MSTPATILFYTETESPHLSYILHTLFSEWYNYSYATTNSKTQLEDWSGPCINYSAAPIRKNELHIVPEGLLSESAVREARPVVVGRHASAILFPSREQDGMGYDIFSAAFWLLSRMEEYLPFQPDEHGRFEAQESIAHAYNFLSVPIIQYWMQELLSKIKQRNNTFPLHKPAYDTLTTIDVDQPYAFLNRGRFQQLKTAVNSLAHRKSHLLKSQFNTVLLKKNDPYDTYKYLFDLVAQTKEKILFFFLIGGNSKYDKGVPAPEVLRTLITGIASAHETGLHPSYNTMKSKPLLQQEIRAFKSLSGSGLKNARQHYIRLSIPETYRNYVDNDITNDYSMGYNTQPGFRAGTALPFRWFDLTRNTATPLKVHSFCYMDVTLFEMLKLSSEEACEMIRTLFMEVKKCGGTFSSIWHNNTVSGFGEWSSWKKVFEFSIELRHSSAIEK